MNVAIETLETRRKQATVGLDKMHRSTFGQFFTAQPVARFMASLVEPTDTHTMSILDAGAGIGLLSAAVLERFDGRGKVTAYELEPSFQTELACTLKSFPGQHEVICKDFIQHTIETIVTGNTPDYDIAILNPPYKKIPTGSIQRALVSKLGVVTSNLYTCFLACAIVSCRSGGQIIVIIPRSFMNGPYFKAFRYWLLDRVAITHIHTFKSRNKAFSDDNVLQENVILRLVVRGVQGQTVVSASTDQNFTDMSQRVVPFSEILTPGDDEKFIHVPSFGAPNTCGLPGQTLREIGLDVCTGPVVDFRLREHLRAEPVKGSVPLIYSSHFSRGTFKWPRESRKPNAIMVNADTQTWLMRKGCYVVLRRFTSKEEKRRIVAYLLHEDALPGNLIGFENHLNVIHQDRHGLEPAVALGIWRYLNSQAVDDYFRTFSGHTQVNATDLRRLRYPALEALKALGKEHA